MKKAAKDILIIFHVFTSTHTPQTSQYNKRYTEPNVCKSMCTSRRKYVKCTQKDTSLHYMNEILLRYSAQLVLCSSYINIISSFIPRLNKLLFDPKGHGNIFEKKKIKKKYVYSQTWNDFKLDSRDFFLLLCLYVCCCFNLDKISNL